MSDNELDFMQTLAEKLRALSNKSDGNLSSRITINLSKEELDTCAWCIEQNLEGIAREE